MPKKTPKYEPVSPIVRTTEWEHDAPVKITSDRLVGKKGHKYNYRCHAVNSNTGSEWIEVVGGPRGYEGAHAFKVDEVTLVPPKRKRKSRAN